MSEPRLQPVLTVLLISLCACSDSKKAPPPATVPDFQAATFAAPTQVTNPYLPLVPGTVNTYFSEADGETIVVEVLETTRMVSGVECVVVRDRVFEGELLIEDTHDWYAQDDAGNVWYMGEEVDNYEYDDDDNLLSIDHEGAWEAGLDVAGTGAPAQPGILVHGNPLVGTSYYQEFYGGEAEDEAQVVSLAATVTLEDGRSFSCLQLRESTALDPLNAEFKYFAPGIGVVKEQKIGTTETVEHRARFDLSESSVPDFGAAFFTDPSALTNPLFAPPAETAKAYLGIEEDGREVMIIELLDETRMVMGLECAVVRDRVFEDGLLKEDTYDWYAQDDAGNVWYMGEDVDNYVYDEDDELIEVNHESAWEAGLDIHGVGELAQPGHQVQATPVVGHSFYQEYYPEEATDMAFVAAIDRTVELADGREFTDCLEVVEWNPLEPAVLEVKLHAPGVGLVAQFKLGEESDLEHQGDFALGEDAIPDFAAATFTNPDEITHPFLQFLIANRFTYEQETEDGLETVELEVLDLTETVLGLECAVVRDVVDLEGLVIEDTHDWYAQDDDGNVWYMGEDVVNYEYDDDDNLLGTNDDGSWVAGLDPAGTGEVARAGILMRAAPVVGDSHYQEFYAEEAEDLVFVVSTDATVHLASGASYTGCLQTLEWNPLDAGGLEHKFYAPGVGLVLEVDLAGNERVELVAGP